MPWSRCLFRTAGCIPLLLGVASNCAYAQEPSPDMMKPVLQRLDALERQNQELLAEVRALREQLKNQTVSSSSPPEHASVSETTEERIGIAEERIKEQAESKVGASQKFPLAITGMFLFDAFLTRGTNNETFLANYGDYSLGAAGGGATLRQSVFGLEFHGPHSFLGGRISGSLSMDFFHRTGEDDTLRIRRGIVSLDWGRRSLTIGQDKPLIAPLEPTSFARVGIPPLSGSGNLWLWLPQARYEERVPFSDTTQAAFQVSLLETDESYSNPQLYASNSLAPARPAIEARVELRHSWGAESKLAVGVGGHTSNSRILGQSVPSRVISTDMTYKPLTWLELTSTLLHGENFANLGGIQPGVTLVGQAVLPIHGTAGWLQVALPVTNRLTFDVYAGLQYNNARDLSPFEVSRSLGYAGNVLYRLAPNVVVGFEGSEDRIEYLNRILISTRRYDATLAYLF